MAIALLPIAEAQAHKVQVLYSFTGAADGGYPQGSVAMDQAGNIYGTTWDHNSGDYGVVFKLAPDGKETVFHTFSGANDGALPSGLVRDSRTGILYGTAQFAGNCDECGVIFKVTPDGSFSVVHAFVGSDGGEPVATPLVDPAGNLFGTTSVGGSYGYGVVYKLTSDGSYSTLYSFTGGLGGANPSTNVVVDRSANLYGATLSGGNDVCGCAGVIFRLSPDGSETVIHDFMLTGDVGDGSPQYQIAMDAEGNIYGTAQGGYGRGGEVYKLAQDGTYSILHAFSYKPDGGEPNGVMLDRKGNVYGTMLYGGRRLQDGTVYRVRPNAAVGRQFTLLHTFTGGNDGENPESTLVRDKQGNLYGTTQRGGASNNGTIFKIATSQ